MEFENNFIYNINYYTDGINSCEESGCNDEGVCRCFKIIDIEIKNIDILSISEVIYKRLSFNKRSLVINDLLYDHNIDIFLIERILSINKLYLKSNWEFKVNSGYYGDEINSISIKSDIYKNIIIQLKECSNLKSLENKIKFLLKLEYGFINDSLSNIKFEIINVPKSEIFFPQKNHYNICLKNKYYDFLNKENKDWYIYGICKYDGTKYSVIDGYNRISITNKKELKIIKCY